MNSRTQEIQDRLNNIKPGNWQLHYDLDTTTDIMDSEGQYIIDVPIPNGMTEAEGIANRDFVVNSRADIEFLLERNDSLLDKNMQLTKIIKDFIDANWVETTTRVCVFCRQPAIDGEFQHSQSCEISRAKNVIKKNPQ